MTTETEKLEKAFKDYDCAREGHVWINTKTGLLYVRDKTQTGTTQVFCRHCSTPNELKAFGKATSETPLTERVNEYEQVPAFIEIESAALEAALITSAQLDAIANEAQ